MSAMFSSLAVRNYRWWFAGALVSNTGVWMQRIAQDWLVLTELTDNDAGAVGITMALNFGPQLLLAPLTGAIADRVDRRTLIYITQASMALLALTLGILTVTGVVELWMVFCVALGLGIASAFDAPARQAFVSELVPAAKLGNAVALNATAFNGARLVGPAIAGVLVAVIGSGSVFFINTAAYAAVFAALALLRRADFVGFKRSPRSPTAIVDGMRYVRRRPDIKLVLVIVFLVGMFGLNFSLFVATMSRVVFEQGAEVFGVLTSAMAIGSVAGALLAARRERPRLRVVSLAAGGMGVALGLGALAPSIWTFGAAMLAGGFFSLTMLTTANAYVQTTTSPAFRGRVMALYLAVLFGGTPVGAPLLGWASNTFGPRWALGAGAAGCLVAAVIAVIWFLRNRQVSIRWNRASRWPLRLHYGATEADRELATTEIAVVEAESQKT